MCPKWSSRRRILPDWIRARTEGPPGYSQTWWDYTGVETPVLAKNQSLQGKTIVHDFPAGGWRVKERIESVTEALPARL